MPTHILGRPAFWANLSGASLIAILATTPILMSAVMDRGYEIAKLSVAEPLAFLAVAALFMAGEARPVFRPSPALRPAILALAAFAILATISAALGEAPVVSLFGGYFRREGMIAWFSYLAVFVAVLGWTRDAPRLSRLIDVLLLTSVVPCTYAIQQRLDLDFFFVATRDLARPNSTLGNPVFLAAYLATLLPICLVRAWQARGERSRALLWLVLAATQGSVLLVTQSRGPLLAAIIGLLLLACLAAGRFGARRFFFAAAITAIALFLFVAAINVFPRVGARVQDLPVANRLIFALDRGTGAETLLASRSAATRLGIWQAGADTFAAAPLLPKLIGFGPESAYMHYFAHMPPSVMRTEGYWQSHTFDRLHADTLDIGLNFGLLGWIAYCIFFAATIHAAARTLFGLEASRSAWLLLLASAGGGLFAATLASVSGMGAAAAPAFGLGVGGGWFAYLVVIAWKRHDLANRAHSPLPPGHWGLLAGLTSALLVFWFDAQINIPVMTTRLLSFCIAAMILLLASGKFDVDPDAAGSPSAYTTRAWSWALAFSLVATCASFFPPVVFDAAAHAHDVRGFWLRVLPMAILLAFGALSLWLHVWQRHPANAQTQLESLAVAIGLPLIFAVLFRALRTVADAQIGPEMAHDISTASFVTPLTVLALCAGMAVMETGNAVSANASKPTAGDRFAAIALLAVMASVLAFAWIAVRADVASRSAQWADDQQKTEASDLLVAEAIELMPYERYYRRQAIFAYLARAVADIRQFRGAPESRVRVDGNLSAAESRAREYQLRFPIDPWAVLALANVLQFRALHLIRPLDPAAGERAAEEARELFARAHRLFPTQPLLLRNWAQLEFDEGNVGDAYRLLDLMEKLLPTEIEPYQERIVLARQLKDAETVAATLERARNALAPAALEQLTVVASQ